MFGCPMAQQPFNNSTPNRNRQVTEWAIHMRNNIECSKTSSKVIQSPSNNNAQKCWNWANLKVKPKLCKLLELVISLVLFVIVEIILISLSLFEWGIWINTLFHPASVLSIMKRTHRLKRGCALIQGHELGYIEQTNILNFIQIGCRKHLSWEQFLLGATETVSNWSWLIDLA